MISTSTASSNMMGGYMRDAHLRLGSVFGHLEDGAGMRGQMERV